MLYNNDKSKTPALPCAYCRSSLGWVEPEIVKGKPKTYKIPGVLDDKRYINFLLRILMNSNISW